VTCCIHEKGGIVCGIFWERKKLSHRAFLDKVGGHQVRDAFVLLGHKGCNVSQVRIEGVLGSPADEQELDLDIRKTHHPV
jgi:hypothetical protein